MEMASVECIVLLVLIFSLNTTFSSPPCVDVTHSECEDDYSFLETNTPNKEGCYFICLGIGEKCNFFIFDNNAFARGNCRLYEDSFSNYVNHCNELAGPKTSSEGCDFLNPPDNSCQIYRSGECRFVVAEETQYFSSWEHCQASCNSTSPCKYWRFEREERLCRILYSAERNCTLEFSPRDPSLDDCDDNSSTTTTPTTTNPICEIPHPQEHGDWFCPPSNGAVTCHLECHPGYVSDRKTIITCRNGMWSSKPTCIPAIGLITGSADNAFRDTVEVYGEGIHRNLSNLPDNRYVHSLQTTDSNILLCGGYSTLTSCLVLTASQQWRHHSTTTSPRYLHSSVSILGQLHLLGGFSSITTEHISPSTSSTWIPGPDLLQDTSYACAAKINPDVYIVTGGNYLPASVISYNAISGAATRHQDLIKPRFGHGCVYVRDSQTGFGGVLVAGGYDGSIDLNDSEIYNLSTGHWTTTGRLTSARHGVKLMMLGDNILATGGYDGSDALSTVDKFNVTTREWSSTEEMLVKRFSHAVTGVPPTRVGIGLTYN